ncbi:sensor histidine kinase [Pedobacter nutrimenti]|jgi:sensor histidine kinase YesM|uniref:Histidine kinase n=1 Tax=Pedobacter nutrimenti TaxID=1241337 RepID=A0A318UEQ8_9SPHI|nr:histidine kinase [Pedobacter nutrimenti]PYF72607.1 histidine kinase [Pedobacter nutrimenti]
MRKSWKREMVLNFSNKYIRVTVHILVWMVLLALPYVINSNRSTPPHRLDPGEQGQFLKLNLISYFYLIGVFYLNGFVLIQKLFYRHRYFYYTFSVVLVYLSVLLLHYILFGILIHSVDFEWTRAAWFNLPAFLLTIAASTTYIMIYDRIKMEKVDMERERETMKTELSFLRSQISPHFIFNILNNIVALVRLKSADLEPTVMKLSGLMQYMLYETDEEKVSLKTEQEYLNSYIDLQKQRFGKKVKVETEIELANENQEIEPMLLIPFVENAFKHGVGLIEHPQIRILLKTDRDSLSFMVYNKFSSYEQEVKDHSSGIGLANVSRRLKLLYGNDHRLSIEKDGDWFKVDLWIKFNV